MSRLDDAFALIEMNMDKGGDFCTPKPVWLIQAAETALGCLFPDDYRRFLERYGCGGLAGLEVYGLAKADEVDWEKGVWTPGIPSAVGITLRARKQQRIDASELIIGSTGEGGDIILNLETGRVYRVSHGEEELVGVDFGEYLFDALEEALEYWE